MLPIRLRLALVCALAWGCSGGAESIARELDQQDASGGATTGGTSEGGLPASSAGGAPTGGNATSTGGFATVSTGGVAAEHTGGTTAASGSLNSSGGTASSTGGAAAPQMGGRSTGGATATAGSPSGSGGSQAASGSGGTSSGGATAIRECTYKPTPTSTVMLDCASTAGARYCDAGLNCVPCSTMGSHYLDCDGDGANACEADMADPKHCGSCDRVCSAGQQCKYGVNGVNAWLCY